MGIPTGDSVRFKLTVQDDEIDFDNLQIDAGDEIYAHVGDDFGQVPFFELMNITGQEVSCAEVGTDF